LPPGTAHGSMRIKAAFSLCLGLKSTGSGMFAGFALEGGFSWLSLNAHVPGIKNARDA